MKLDGEGGNKSYFYMKYGGLIKHEQIQVVVIVFLDVNKVLMPIIIGMII